MKATEVAAIAGAYLFEPTPYADERGFFRQETIDRVHRVLSPLPIGKLGAGLALRALENAEQFGAAELHERVHLQRGDLVLEAGVDVAGGRVAVLGRGRVLHYPVIA